ncbi:MAG TPA: hypothetical protein PK680_03840 [Novosphingobium sp.]|nr:hypothetical protein [Novosphingobium sp.]HQA17497.1 hypothetical protein [Novosphingobium sp.]
MDIANDLMASLRDRVAPPSPLAEMPTVDWAELHARLSAAHAAAAEIVRSATGDFVAAGGFANWKAGISAVGNASRAVNPTDLADGKCAAGIEDFTAGDAKTGGRGQ